MSNSYLPLKYFLTELSAIILVSGAVQEIRDHREILRRYHVAVLEKPFDIDDLLALVARQLVR